MRITELQQQTIHEAFREHFLPQDHLWLFGSRANPLKKGGDIDLYIETHANNWAQISNMQINFLVAIKKKIGDQKIDVIINPLPLKLKKTIYEEGKKGILLA